MLFVDNEAAVSTLIRGTSVAEDSALMAELLHALCLILGCRLWVEWIDSESNPSDGLSREGLDDRWTRRQGYSPAALPGHHFPNPRDDIFQWAQGCLHWAYSGGL